MQAYLIGSLLAQTRLLKQAQTVLRVCNYARVANEILPIISFNIYLLFFRLYDFAITISFDSTIILLNSQIFEQ